jgi:hypothetical protein
MPLFALILSLALPSVLRSLFWPHRIPLLVDQRSQDGPFHRAPPLLKQHTLILLLLRNLLLGLFADTLAEGGGSPEFAPEVGTDGWSTTGFGLRVEEDGGTEGVGDGLGLGTEAC